MKGCIIVLLSGEEIRGSGSAWKKGGSYDTCTMTLDSPVNHIYIRQFSKSLFCKVTPSSYT